MTNYGWSKADWRKSTKKSKGIRVRCNVEWSGEGFPTHAGRGIGEGGLHRLLFLTVTVLK